MNIQDLWATRDPDIGDVYGVGLEDEDEYTDNENLDPPGEVTSSSSYDLHNPLAITSSNPASQLVFVYDVDEAVL